MVSQTWKSCMYVHHNQFFYVKFVRKEYRHTAQTLQRKVNV